MRPVRNGQVETFNHYATDAGEGRWNIYNDTTGERVAVWYENEISRRQQIQLSALQDLAPSQNAHR